jgi:hypothetical protein
MGGHPLAFPVNPARAAAECPPRPRRTWIICVARCPGTAPAAAIAPAQAAPSHSPSPPPALTRESKCERRVQPAVGCAEAGIPPAPNRARRMRLPRPRLHAHAGAGARGPTPRAPASFKTRSNFANLASSVIVACVAMPSTPRLAHSTHGLATVARFERVLLPWTIFYLWLAIFRRISKIKRNRKNYTLP